MTDEELAREAIAPLFSDSHSMTKDALLAAIINACAKARAEGSEYVEIKDKQPPVCLPWEPHEGPPHMGPTEALRLYHEKRSDALSRTVMTDHQRAEFVGDAKPTS